MHTANKSLGELWKNSDGDGAIVSIIYIYNYKDPISQMLVCILGYVYVHLWSLIFVVVNVIYISLYWGLSLGFAGARFWRPCNTLNWKTFQYYTYFQSDIHRIFVDPNRFWSFPHGLFEPLLREALKNQSIHIGKSLYHFGGVRKCLEWIWGNSLTLDCVYQPLSQENASLQPEKSFCYCRLAWRLVWGGWVCRTLRKIHGFIWDPVNAHGASFFFKKWCKFTSAKWSENRANWSEIMRIVGPVKNTKKKQSEPCMKNSELFGSHYIARLVQILMPKLVSTPPRRRIRAKTMTSASS